MYVAVHGEESDIVGPSDVESTVTAAGVRRKKRTTKMHDIFTDSEGGRRRRDHTRSPAVPWTQ